MSLCPSADSGITVERGPLTPVGRSLPFSRLPPPSAREPTQEDPPEQNGDENDGGQTQDDAQPQEERRGSRSAERVGLRCQAREHCECELPRSRGSVHGRTSGRSRVRNATRHSFAKIPDVLELPDLIELQKASFKWFITDGLSDAFDSISPIKDFTGNLVLEFGEHSLGEPKYSVEECRERDMTYSAPLRVRVRLITSESGEIKGIPDQEIFMGDFPLMTDKGTFMINGAERVIVSQLVRSPGVYFLQDADTNNRADVQRDDHPEPRRLDRVRDRQRHEERRDRGHDRRPHRQEPQDLRDDLRARALAPDLATIGRPTKRSSRCSTTRPLIANCLEKDKDIKTREDALKEIYKKLRPGEPENAENAEKLLESLFFDEKRYDLAGVGRYKLTGKLERESRSEAARVTQADPREPKSTRRRSTREDMIAVVRQLIEVAPAQGQHRRHRPSRQPPHPLGRRAAAEPVPRRLAAPRARRARAHDRARHRDGHAAGADQHPAGRRGDQRVLRLLASSRSSWTRRTRSPS